MDIITIQVLLLVIFTVSVSDARGRRINIYGAENGHSDIVQLRGNMAANQQVFNSPIRERRPTLRNALLSNSPLKWSKMQDSDGNYVIPFVISGNYDSLERKIIKSAMEKIAQNTCIRLIPRTNQPDYAEILNKKGQGCYASIGRFPGKNVVMLESNDDQSCIQEDTVIHELFHVIGLWHEHMRADRDAFINVMYKNIEPAQYPQFEKLSSRDATTYNVPYDYKSVMHYDETAFAKPGKISMMTKDSKFQKVIGHPRDASSNDYKKVCAIYHCSKCMNQDFDQLVIRDNIDLRNPVITNPPVKQGDSSSDCTDRLGICPMLKSREMLNCKVMSTFCCSSCSAPTSTTTTTSSTPSDSSLWQRIKSIFQ
ncbi:CRE-NAS-5 protein [Caenorhabditis remanei]|uniref:Metalloendopeptidase n=1 Tax=Caenorhabditis remanei TaxID=31234 RepID=E3M3B6_CAERE|nr:CRE-NAS-5 protein [Caenorhabditis remanei]